MGLAVLTELIKNKMRLGTNHVNPHFLCSGILGGMQGWCSGAVVRALSSSQGGLGLSPELTLTPYVG